MPEGEPTWGSHRVLLWNLDTGEEQELDAWKSQEGSSGRTTLWHDGKLYWCSYDKPDAIHWKAPNESTGEIAVSWPDEISNAEETTFVLDDIVQGHALFTVWGPWGTDLLKRYAVDLNQPDSTPIEIPLRYVSNASERPVTILGKGEGQLLVQFQEQASFVAQLDADGSPSKDLQISASVRLNFVGRFSGRKAQLPRNFCAVRGLIRISNIAISSRRFSFQSPHGLRPCGDFFANNRAGEKNPCAVQK